MLHPQTDHTKNRFLYYRVAHFGNALCPVGKNDRYFNDAKIFRESAVFHLDLESVTNELYAVELERLDHGSFVANKTRCRITNLHSGNEPNVSRCKIGH